MGMDFFTQAGENHELLKDAFVSGKNPFTNDKLTFKDALSVANAPIVLPRVMTEIAMEGVEPNLVLSSLLDQVGYEPGMQIISGGIGSMVAADIPEMGEYPEEQLQMGGATSTIQIGKSGVSFKLSEEMRRYSRFDMLGLHLRAAGRALARHKEKKVATYLSNMGVTVFDNAAPTASLYGTTTGRSAAGAQNGTITGDDIFDMFAVGINNGFMCNTFIVHPLMWVVFMKDPQLRAFAEAAGGGAWWGSFSGRPDGRAPWGIPKQSGTTGQSITPPNVQSLPVTHVNNMPQVPTLTSAPVAPPHMMPFPYRFVVSPFVYYNAASQLTDLILCDSSELGALLIDEPVSIDGWDEKARDIHRVKLRERYAIFIYNDGGGILVAKNVKVAAHALVEPTRLTLDAASIPALNRTTAVV